MISVFQAQKAFAANGQHLPHREGQSLYDLLSEGGVIGDDTATFPTAFEAHTPSDLEALYKALQEEELEHVKLRAPPLTNRRLTNRPTDPNAWKEY